MTDRSDPTLAARAEAVVLDLLGRAVATRVGRVVSLRDAVRVEAIDVGTRGKYRAVRCRVRHWLSGCTEQLNAVTGEEMGWYLDAIARHSSDALPAEACLAEAERAGAPPPGAVLERAEFEVQAAEARFVAEWRHEEDGVAVAGDGLLVLVNGRTGLAFGVFRKWHELDPTPRER